MKTQKQIMQEQGRRASSVIGVFQTIQAGSTPLSKHEIQELIKLRPEVYGCLAGWAK